MTELVSIIIPVYNSEKFIYQTLQSCLCQTYKNLELVIVNDGSTDRSEKIIFNTLKDSHCKVNYVNQLNVGLCGARNRGINIANGSLILFLDSDDLLFPNSIETLVATIDNFDVVIGSWMDFDSKSGKITNEVNYRNDINNNTLLSYLTFKPTVSTALIAKTSLTKWDESLKTWDVTKYFIDLFSEGKKFKFIGAKITCIRQHNNPNRLSIINNHFEPIYSSSFFADCKKLLQKAGKLDRDSEKTLDKDIMNYIYQAYNSKNSATCRNTFYIINLDLVRTYTDYKRFGLYNFIVLLKGFYGIVLFKTLNKLLGRT